MSHNQKDFTKCTAEYVPQDINTMQKHVANADHFIGKIPPCNI